jgi:uncharacterized protein (TIGR02246 family)
MVRTGVPLMIAFVAVSLSYSTAARSDETRESIESTNRAFAAAFLRGDTDAVAELYTRDAQLIPPGADVVSGRSAIAAFWKGALEAGVTELALETEQVEWTGDLAYEIGAARLVAAGGRVSQDRYLVVWKRENGKWQLHRDIWNAPN